MLKILLKHLHITSNHIQDIENMNALTAYGLQFEHKKSPVSLERTFYLGGTPQAGAFVKRDVKIIFKATTVILL